MAKSFIQKLVSDEQGRRLYFREDLIFEITEAICKTMREKHVTKAELSRRAGVSKSNITQLLSGDHNMRLTTVADLLYALDSKLQISTVPLDSESILEMAAPTVEDFWTPARDFMSTESGHHELREREGRQLTQAA
jgi:transcriptional regulator with XRE-family HTH domain